MADAAKFGSAKDMHRFYQDSMRNPNQGFRLGGSGPLVSANPRPIELTDRVFHPPVPAERGFRLQGGGSFTQAARPIELTDRVFENPPALRPNTTPAAGLRPSAVPRVNVLPTGAVPPNLPGSGALVSPSVGVHTKGFTMGGPQVIDVTATSVPKPPLQIGYGYTPPKGFVGPNIPAEGMGDFAPPQTGSVGKGLGLRSTLRSVGRVAFGPEALAVQALAIPAAAQARATANSNGPVLGLKRGQRIFGMTGGPRPGEAFSTNAISYTDPVTGNPVAVSQAPEQVVTPAGLRPTPAIPWEQSDARAKMIDYTAGNDAPVEPAASAPVQTDSHGYAVVDGNKIAYGDIGDPTKDAAYANSTGFSVSTLPADQMPGAEYVGIAAREAQRKQAEAAQFKTMDDFLSNRSSGSGEGAAFGLRFAAARAAQYNRNLDNQMEMEQKRQELGLKGQELGLKGQELGLTARKYQSEDIVNRAHADYYKGVEADRTSKAEKEAWLMSPEGQAFTLRSKGHEEDQEAEKSAQKAYTDAIARGGDPLAAENAYVASKGLRKGLRVVPGAPATPSKGALFWKKEAQPATSAVAAPPAAVAEYNAAMTAAGDDTKKKALIDARFRATYGGL